MSLFYKVVSERKSDGGLWSCLFHISGAEYKIGEWTRRPCTENQLWGPLAAFINLNSARIFLRRNTSGIAAPGYRPAVLLCEIERCRSTWELWTYRWAIGLLPTNSTNTYTVGPAYEKHIMGGPLLPEGTVLAERIRPIAKVLLPELREAA